MDLERFVNLYLSRTKFFATIVGVWPYQGLPQKYILHAYVYILVILAMVTQVGNIAVHFSVETIRDQVPFVMAGMSSALKYWNHMLNNNTFEKLFNSMLKDWQDKNTQEEKMILEKYADRGVFFIFLYLINAYFCALVFLLLPIVPHAMDTLVPLNESRPRIQMYPAYYFIENDDDYYYPIILFTSISFLTAMCVFIATDTILVYIVQHACGLLALAGYRFKSSLDRIHALKDDAGVNDEVDYEKVCYAIRTHKQALAYISEIEDAYAMNLFAQVGLIITSFTITLLKVASITLSLDTYPYYGFLIAQLVHVFFLTVQGQFVIDLHEKIYQMTYEARWYEGHVKSQVLFVLVQRKNLTPPLLTAGGLIQLNLDSFAEIVKACVSYFTMLKSV